MSCVNIGVVRKAKDERDGMSGVPLVDYVRLACIVDLMFANTSFND